jgi:PadR family transcriptional regulator PadR
MIEGATESRRKWGSQIRKGSLEMCVLRTVSDRPRYGFEIAQFLNEAGVAVTEGTLYPLLNRLQADGQIASLWQESNSGPPRKYYSLTSDGQAALAWMQEEWSAYADAVNRLLNRRDQAAAPMEALEVAPREKTK